MFIIMRKMIDTCYRLNFITSVNEERKREVKEEKTKKRGRHREK